MSIGKPWDGNQGVDDPNDGRTKTLTWDDGTQATFVEYEFGIQYTNELGQSWDQPLIIPVRDDEGNVLPDVVQIGSEKFRLLPG